MILLLGLIHQLVVDLAFQVHLLRPTPSMVANPLNFLCAASLDSSSTLPLPQLQQPSAPVEQQEATFRALLFDVIASPPSSSASFPCALSLS